MVMLPVASCSVRHRRQGSGGGNRLGVQRLWPRLWVNVHLVRREGLVVVLVDDAVTARRAARGLAQAPGVGAHKLAAFLGRLLRQGLDILVPGHHGVMALGAEDPCVSSVHRARLAALEDELVGRSALGRVRTKLLLRQVERHDWGLRLVRRLELVEMALEVLALALQQTGTDLLGSNVILAGIVDLLRRPHRNRRINNLVVVGHEMYPFLVLGHGDGAVAELLDDPVGVVGLALQDAGVGIVRLLNLANDNRLQLAAGALEVEVRLVEVVLLVNLALDLAIYGQTQQVRILPTRRGRGINLVLVQDIGERVHGLFCAVHFAIDGVLEVAGKVLDLLDLLLEIAPETGEGEDDVLLDLLGLVGLLDGGPVVVAQELEGIVDTGRLEEVGGRGDVVGDVGELAKGLGSVLVVRLDLAVVGD
ncbi:hypothetical protein TCAP_00901 [Tolypocladium capitatum]|uniref:Uncharacterized protein n=1 Tax=Tolypocladium capitatum TaxID=45235 RepID=A0A2K3QNS8_9HYPO|nr:hypothetical protein TCAP_00901 [Tolypocladium capitatum]